MIETPFFPRVQRLLAVLALTLMLTALLVNWKHPYAMDFLSFWAAGKLAATGNAAAAYDVAAHHAVHLAASPVDAKLPFGYPPWFIFTILPFGLIPYPISAPLWVCATLAAFAWAISRIAPAYTAAAIAFPPVAICAILGQSGLLIAALLIGAMTLLPTRPWLAGILLGCIAIKPQLGLLIPLALVAGSEWRAFAGAALSVVLLAVASLAAFGWSAWQGFFDQAGLMTSIATDNAVGWQKMASIYAGLRLSGVPDTLAWGIHAALAALGAYMVWKCWRVTDDPIARAAILAPATLLVSPYLYVYDQVLLIVSLVWLARKGLHPAILASLFALPLLQALQFSNTQAGLNVAPLLTILLFMLVRDTLRATPRLKQLWAPPPERLHRHDPQIVRNCR